LGCSWSVLLFFFAFFKFWSAMKRHVLIFMLDLTVVRMSGFV
jgi:hypothetical protein